MSLDIRFTTLGELSLVQEFLTKHWYKNHILAHDTELLKWQHLDVRNNRLNFVVAYDNEKKDIKALLGFIPVSQYDSSLEDERDVWGAIWKTTTSSLLGLQLLFFLQQELNLNTYAGIGLSELAQKAYRYLGYRVGEMEHYYLLNPTLPLKIADAKGVPSEQVFPDAILREITSEQVVFLDFDSLTYPKKNITYVCNRFVKHPTYTYRYFLVQQDQKDLSLIIARKIIINNSSVLRVVDWLGNYEADIDYRKSLLELLCAESIEYVDLVCKVRKDRFFFDRGFCLRNSEKEIIPNYFEPFEKRNKILHYMVHTNHNEFVFFKGDSDQDRPNLLCSHR